MKKETKRTITFKDKPYQLIKAYCKEHNLVIGGFAEKALLYYINLTDNGDNKNEK